jgi:hypothetical protein
MKEFSKKIHVDNKPNFKACMYERNMCYLRKLLYEHIMKNDENTYFQLDEFAHKYGVHKDEIEPMAHKVSAELVKLGWKCRLAFGSTGLFVYSSEEPPISCYSDDLV